MRRGAGRHGARADARGWLRTAAALAALLAVESCRDASEARIAEHRAPAADGVAAGVSSEGVRHVRTILGFNDPESVRYDADQDALFVSNVAGFGSHHDGNGYIVRVPADSLAHPTLFVAGGRNGTTLHAPKGMAIQGDTLWVTDIDVVRGFHRRTGAPVGTIDFAHLGPVQLNDVAAGPDGALRVTDTGIRMVYEGNVPVGGDRVFEVRRGRVVTTVATGGQLALPNGITWDATGARWVFVAFDRFHGNVTAMSAPPDTVGRLLRSGTGQLDGIEALRNGTLAFSSWADSSIHVLDGDVDTRIIREVPEPADIGIDTRRGRILIPLTVLGQVQVWDLGPWW